VSAAVVLLVIAGALLVGGIATVLLAPRGEHRRRRLGNSLAAVASVIAVAAGIVAVVASSDPDVIPAPPTAAFAVVPGARVALSAVTVDDVIGVQDTRRFRSIDLTSDHLTAARLIIDGARYLTGHGWTRLSATVCCSESSRGHAISESPIPTSLNDPRATISLYSRDARLYVAMERSLSNPDLCQARDGAQGENCQADAVALALRAHHRPAVRITSASTTRPTLLPEPGG
jgi:hypothetical protein